ncbi:hypothetical protein [uncultured Tessaracoccus sp.]|uniref:hypothetical protein n=1 Tax=uncultured Tessaracoccus sp. TaxID=905023 RepID=UPI0025E457BB|nr:hypothetical protein [uncultured Tessaracoccus sp.]
MPETRTFDPSEGDDLAKLVRDALGEHVRPTEPGSDAAADRLEQPDPEPDEAGGAASILDLPVFDF